MSTTISPAHVASDLRVVLGQLMRRLRAEDRFPLSQAAVLGRLDRCGPMSVSDLAVAERVRPQSMAQTVSDLEVDGCVTRHADPDDKRRALVELTDAGLARLEADRTARDGWLARTIVDKLSPADQDALKRAVELLRELAES
jgi:DNA-binding MarR family transcriptional regulator